jgi:hypothetical protein
MLLKEIRVLRRENYTTENKKAASHSVAVRNVKVGDAQSYNRALKNTVVISLLKYPLL